MKPSPLQLSELSQLLFTTAQRAALKRLVTGKANRVMVVDGLAGSAAAMLFTALPKGGKPYLIVANDLDEAGYFYHDLCQLTSEAQGEYPSMTQLNKLTAVHPGVGENASALAAYVNNSDCVYLVETVRGKYRVVGSEKWQVKSTVAQDLGQGATGTTSTTLNVEATDECPAPFYEGRIETEDGVIYTNQSPAQPVLDGDGDGDDDDS